LIRDLIVLLDSEIVRRGGQNDIYNIIHKVKLRRYFTWPFHI